MNKDKNRSYNSIFKATSLFGGVEIIRIIVGALQAKILALLLGPAGIGFESIFKTATNMISQITGLGLRTSAVREIAEANNSKDSISISKTHLTLKRWVFILGIFGMIITIIISPLLSKWTFGTNEYTWAFILLSAIMLFTSLNNGHVALIRGMRRKGDYAKTNLISVVLGLILSSILYFALGKEGVIYALIATAFGRMLVSLYFSKKIKIDKIELPFKETVSLGNRMIKLGFFMMLSSSLSLLFSYVLNAYIARESGIEAVGLYRAGFLITTYYVNLVFSAMGADYLPRLSEINKDNTQIKEIVNQQAEIANLIIFPLIISLITIAPIIIQLLYSKEFLGITNFIVWAIVAMLFKASSWSMSYILLAKGKGVLFFATEVSIGIFHLVANIVGYKLFGLEGMGIAYLINYTLYFVIHYTLDKKLFDFSFSKEYVKIFIITNIVCILALLLYKVFGYPNMYYIGAIILIFSFGFSYVEISKRVDVKGIYKSIKNKIKFNKK